MGDSLSDRTCWAIDLCMVSMVQVVATCELVNFAMSLKIVLYLVQLRTNI